MKSLEEKATPGLHDEVFAYVKKLFPKGCGPVLDLGGGTGAWSERLLNSGFTDILVIDLFADKFQGKVPCMQGDLNAEFTKLVGDKKFALITAIEVIEHLENPSYFLRQCKHLLQPDGILILTSPNIESMPARIKFFVSGRLRHFDSHGDKTHITPIDRFLFSRLAKQAGLTLSETLPLVSRWFDNRRIFIAVSSLLAQLVGGEPYGACRMYVVRKNCPEAETPHAIDQC